MTILRINWRNDIRMIEIKVLQAHQGDCIWVRCISEKTVNIVIDAGTSTFKKGFRNLVKEINNKKERIDLLVFSHIDDDHIKGCIQYLQEKEEKIIDKVWINGSGSRVYSDMQEHSVNNVSNLVTLIMEKNIPIETPILEGKEYVFCGGRIKVIGPTKNEMLKVATKIEHSNQVTEHAGYKYVGNIIDVQDKYQPDLSDSNKASIIMVVEFENKKLLFTGDSTSENIIKAVDKYYPGDSKIDSFVYATKPSDMYNEWGNFWDPDNKQREIFESVYNVYKKICNEIKDYTEQLGELENKLKQLNIEQKVGDYNKSVESYNRLLVKGIPDLPYIEYFKNNKININSNLFSKKAAEQLSTYISNQNLVNSQCKFLQDYFEDYQNFIGLQQEMSNRKKRWERIISKCQKKRELLLQAEDLENKGKKYIESRDKLLAEFDKSWFDDYQKYIRIKTKYQILNEQLENKRAEMQKVSNHIEDFKKSIENCSRKKNSVLIKCEEWKKQIKALDIQEKSLFKEDTLNSLKEKKEKVDEQRQIYEKELFYLNKASVGEYEKFIESLTSDELLLYHWIKEWDENEKKLKGVLNASRLKERDAKYRYETMRENVNSLDNLLTLAKKEIQKNDTCICPVCKSKFGDQKELLGKIDMSVQRDTLLMLKTQWDSAIEILKKAEDDYRMGCEDIKTSINTKAYTIEQLIVSCEQESIRYKKEWNEKQELIQEVKEKKERLKQAVNQDMEIDIGRLSVESVENACEKSLSIIDQMLIENENNIKEQQKKQESFFKEIKQNEILADEFRKEIEDFSSNSSNLQKREIMEQRKIFSYEEFQTIIEEYKDKIQQCEFEKKEVQDMLKKYNIYYTDNIEKYRSLLETKKIESADWVERYEQYKEKLFQKQNISKKTITLYLKKVDFNINTAQEKLKIWNECMSDVIVKDFVNEYNHIIEEKVELQQKRTFSENKEKIAKDIFQTVRTQLEEHIKKAFGGVTISQIYSKIEPHKRFTKLQYKVSINDNSAPELYMKVLNSKNEDIMPELFFSSAQLNTVALSVFLGGALSASNPKVNTIFIDDPIGHFDDLNVLSFIDVLRTIISETDWQIIISTHEESFYEIMKVKLNPKYYNSKFLIFKDEGNVEEDVKV